MSTQKQENQKVLLDSKVNLQFLLESHLTKEQYPEQLLKTICHKIFPVESSLNVYVSLSRNIINYFSIQFNKGLQYQNIVNEIIKMASPISESISVKLKYILDLQDVKLKVHSYINIKNKPVSFKNPLAQISKKSVFEQKNERDFFSNIYRDNSKKQKQKLQYHPSQIAANYMMEKNNHSVNNLCMNKYKCVCQKQIGIQDEKERLIFVCENCQIPYHKECMKRDKYCSFCYMKKMNPLKRINKEAFIGLLRKGQAKHEINFTIKEDLKLRQIQIRCMRLKGDKNSLTKNINLFPDACNISLNNKSIKEFTPLHRQSSLKFRRDDVLNISNSVVQGTNKLVLHQRHQTSKKDWKDQRIDIENHILGIYVIENKKMEEIIKESQLNEYEFNESKKLLDNSFLDSDQVTLEKVKIPMTCSMTLQPLEHPGRTVFCKHFSVFDVKNFVLLNSKAQISKWLCPVCKEPAHEFRIDPIFHYLLKYAKEKKRQFTEAVFNIEGDFTLYNKDKSFKDEQQYNSIYDLPIESKYKRFDEEKQVKEEPVKKKKNKDFVVPEECEIVEISE